MKFKMSLVILTISLSLIIPVYADPFLKTLAPWGGDSQTEILAIIRAEKRTDNTPMYLYIFWEGLPIVTRLSDTVINKQHTYMWDVTFTPPQDPQYLEKGSNQIVFWLEDIDGKILTYTCVFTITDRIPQPSWFDDLTQKQIDEITGPQGEKGDEGPIGPAGPQGEKGDEGPIGPAGPQGDKGDVGIQGNDGPLGPAGVQGEVGVSGPKGEMGPAGSLNIILLLVVIVISIVSLFKPLKKLIFGGA